LESQIVKLEKWNEIPCECGKKAKKATVKYKKYNVRGWVCEKCGREYIHPEDSLRISQLEKLKKGVNVKIGQLGVSCIIRIPKDLVKIYKLEKGETVKIIPENLNTLEVKTEH